MASIHFNNQIYTASKSLKYPVTLAASKNKEINDLLQRLLMKGIQNEAVFQAGLKITDRLSRILNFFSGKNYSQSLTSNLTEKPAELRIEEIYEALSSMDPAFKEPFMMHFSGMKMEEISEKLNMPVEKVKNKIEAARLLVMMR